MVRDSLAKGHRADLVRNRNGCAAKIRRVDGIFNLFQRELNGRDGGEGVGQAKPFKGSAVKEGQE